MREEELSVKKISEVRMKRMSYLQNMTAMEQSLAEMNTLALEDAPPESKTHKHDEDMHVDTVDDTEVEGDKEFNADVKGEVLSSDAESLAPMDFRDAINMDESVLAGFQPQSQVALPEPESQNDDIIASKGEIYSLGAPADSSTQNTVPHKSSQPMRTPSLRLRKKSKPMKPISDLSGMNTSRVNHPGRITDTIFEETEENDKSNSQDLFAKETQADSQEPSQTESPCSPVNTTVPTDGIGGSQNATLESKEDSQKTPKSSKKATKEDKMKKKKMKARKSIGF